MIPPERCDPVKHLLIAIPSYSGKLAIETAASIITSQGIDFRVSFQSVSRDPYVDRARNALVTHFLTETDATDLLFVDDDLGFSLDAIARIGHSTRPFVGGSYRTKEDKIKFPADFLPGPKIRDEEGLIEMAMIPTGFLRLNRAVFDFVPHIVYEHQDRRQIGYFRNVVGDGKYVGEDVAFCHEWRSAGGKIFCMSDITFYHVGLKTWEGNLHQHLLSES
jgi:hypothetical protein